MTASSTNTSQANNKNSNNSHKGLSKKNRNIVIGCVVGIGVPLLIIIGVIIYIFCIQSKRTNFIDSNGNIVTAYKQNKVVKFWYNLLGKNVSDEEYESRSPLGSGASEDEMMSDNNIVSPSTLLAHEMNIDDDDDDLLQRNGTTKTTTTTKSASTRHNNSNNGSQERSHDLMMEEEIYYDEHGNELNAKNY